MPWTMMLVEGKCKGMVVDNVSRENIVVKRYYRFYLDHLLDTMNFHLPSGCNGEYIFWYKKEKSKTTLLLPWCGSQSKSVCCKTVFYIHELPKWQTIHRAFPFVWCSRFCDAFQLADQLLGHPNPSSTVREPKIVRDIRCPFWVGRPNWMEWNGKAKELHYIARLLRWTLWQLADRSNPTRFRWEVSTVC